MTVRTTCECILVLMTASMAFGQAAEVSSTRTSLFDGLAFYASYDASIDPDRAAGATSASGKYVAVPGRVGQACSNDTTLSYVAKANLNRQVGSVSFWIKSASTLDGGSKGFRLFTTTWADSLNFQYHPEHQAFFFMTAYTAPGKDWAWDYQLPVRAPMFPKDQWNHVVLVWDVVGDATTGVGGCTLAGGDKRLGYKRAYVNGKVVGSAFIPGIDGADEGTFAFGDKTALTYAIDELMIWNRPLSSQQVASLFNKPENIAKLTHALPPISQPRQWIVYPQLIYRNYADSVVAPGEAFSCELPLENRTDKDVAGQLTLRLLDIWEKPIGEPIVKTFATKPKETIRVPLSFTTNRQGIFKIEATVTIDGKSESRDVTSFACLPAANPPKHPFFGGHISFTPGMPELARRLGYSSNRCHDMTQYTWWDMIEPKRGEFAMNHQYLSKQADALGFDHMGEWFATPFWAITLPDGTHPAQADRPASYPAGWVPTDWDAYKNYVKQAIVRYPNIQLWCIWNEPWSSFFFNGSARDYVKLAEATYATAKATNPNLTLYGMIADNLWGRAVLQGGLLKHCDALTYHSYFGPGQWDDAIRLIRHYREFIAKYAGTDKTVRLTNSESGMTTTTFLRGLDFKELPPEEKRPPMDFRIGAERLVQYYVTTMAEGVEAFYYYFHHPVSPENSYSSWSSVEVTRTPKPFAVAQAQLAWQLDGGKYVGQIELPGSVHAYGFDRTDGQTMIALWSVSGGIVEVATDLPAFDYMGNPIAYKQTLRVTDAPMYLRAKGPAAETLKTLASLKWTVVTAPKVIEIKAADAVGPVAMENYAIASELGTTRMVPIDLRSVVTRGFADDQPSDGKGGWTDEGDLNDCRDMPTGRQTFLNVPFDVIDPATNDGKSVIVLKGRTLPAGPPASTPIRVGRKVRGLFFLHAANYAQIDGARAGAYRITYADGQMTDVPIVIGQNIYDWWFDHRDAEDSRTVPLRMSNAEPSQPFRFPRIWWWENTRQDVAIDSITLTTEPGSPASLILIGLTAGLW